MLNLIRQTGEDEYSYTWRVGLAKENGEIDASWDELLETMNTQFAQEYGESVWRKRYAEGKRWQKVFEQTGNKEQIKQLREATIEMQKERIRLRDERTEHARQLREATRVDMTLDVLAEELRKESKVRFSATPTVKIDGDNDLLVMLSDMHIGLEFDTMTGRYNTDVARARLNLYISEIVRIANMHQSKNCYIAMLGDNISGIIKPQIAAGNRENLVQQIKESANMVVEFVAELSNYFQMVYLTGVNGNHSRVTMRKDEAVLAERLDNLTLWYAEAKLEAKDNVVVIQAPENGLGTYSMFDIRGLTYAMCHGDFDAMSESGIARFITWLGKKPYAVLLGHYHTPEYTVIGDVNVFRCGSLCGSGDDYTVSKRLSGTAIQTVCVCTDEGVEATYQVKLS